MFNLGGIFVRLAADASNFNQGIDSAQSRMASFAGSVRGSSAQGADGLAMLGGAFAKLATPIGIATAAIGAFGAAFASMSKGVEIANSLENKTISLGMAINADGAELAAFRKKIDDMTVSMTGMDVEEMLGIATAGGKLGYTGDELIKFTEAMAKAKVAMETIPAEQIAEAVGKIDASFKFGAQGAAGMASAIAKLADMGASTEADLFNAIQRIAPMAKQMGFSAAETSALASALLDTGLSAEMSATNISKLMMIVNSPASSIRKTLLNALSIGESELKTQLEKGPLAVVELLLRKIRSSGREGTLKMLQGLTLGGAEEAGALLAMATQVDVIAERTRVANEEFRTMATLNSNFDLRSGTTDAQLKTAETKQKLFWEKIGKDARPVWTEMSKLRGDFFGDLGNGFGANMDPIKTFGERLTDIVKTMGDLYQVSKPALTFMVEQWSQLQFVADDALRQLNYYTGALDRLKDVADLQRAKADAGFKADDKDQEGKLLTKTPRRS